MLLIEIIADVFPKHKLVVGILTVVSDRSKCTCFLHVLPWMRSWRNWWTAVTTAKYSRLVDCEKWLKDNSW